MSRDETVLLDVLRAALLDLDRPRREWEASSGAALRPRAADSDLGRRVLNTSAVETDGESPHGGVARQCSAGESPNDLATRHRAPTTARSDGRGAQSEAAPTGSKPLYLTKT